MKADREVPLVEGVPLGLAVLGELLDGGLDERDAAEVAVHLHVVDQVVDRAEAVLVLVGPDQLQVLPLVEDGLGEEVADDERDGLAVVAVGGVADQPGAGVGAATEQEHGKSPV